MIKNMAYLPSVSPSSIGSGSSPHYYVYGHEDSIVSSAIVRDFYGYFGVLYNWEAAKTACPSGWHLPSDQEWKTLEMYCGMSPLDVDDNNLRFSGKVGLKLKSTTGWWRCYNENGEYGDGNGENSSGFNGFPGGEREEDKGFLGQGAGAQFWSSDAWVRSLSCGSDGVYRRSGYYRNGYSVRCLQN